MHSKHVTGSALFNPLTPALPLVRTGELRHTLRMDANSGLCGITAAWQVSDDGYTWSDGSTTATPGTFTTFGGLVANNGVSSPSQESGTDWTDPFSPTVLRQFVRFGVAVQNTGSTSTENESCVATLRVDWRSRP